MQPTTASEPVRIELRDPAPVEVDHIHTLQRMLLTHPVACQAAFAALIAEGRRFAETLEGQICRDRLMNSALLRQVRLVFDLSTLGMLEEKGDAVLPSTYLDAVFMIAAGGDAEAVLNRVFWSGNESGSGNEKGSGNGNGTEDGRHERSGD